MGAIKSFSYSPWDAFNELKILFYLIFLIAWILFLTLRERIEYLHLGLLTKLPKFESCSLCITLQLGGRVEDFPLSQFLNDNLPYQKLNLTMCRRATWRVAVGLETLPALCGHLRDTHMAILILTSWLRSQASILLVPLVQSCFLWPKANRKFLCLQTREATESGWDRHSAELGW